MGESRLAKEASPLRIPAPALIRWSLPQDAALAPAGEQHDESDSGSQPDCSLNRQIHMSPFVRTRVLSCGGWLVRVVVTGPNYRLLLRDRRRFRNSIIIPPA